MITLTGEQKRVLTLPLNSPIQIKGVAGSGKTTIAIYRARHIVESTGDLFRNTNICIFSYTKSLVKYVRSILEPPIHHGAQITVTTFHKWAYDFLRGAGYWDTHRVARTTLVDTIISDSVDRARPNNVGRAILNKPNEFYKEEFSWLKGRMIFQLETYLNARRTGRGTTDRVTSQDKELLWSLYESYRRGLQEHAAIDYDDFALAVLSQIEKSASFTPPFSHIVIDEAQDLTPAQLSTIAKLVSTETNSLTVIADAAQRIYKSGFSWTDIGINIRGGRTVELKHNYRNTEEIARAAQSLLKYDPQLSDFTEHVLPTRKGNKPRLLHLTQGQQDGFVIRQINQIDLQKESAVVLHRNRKGVSSLDSALRSSGHTPMNIRAVASHIAAVGLYTCTMPSVKGLEFDHVFICDLNDDVIPYPPGFSDDKDELHISTERRLLYTCMTRARSTLHMISTGNPSRYLAEIDPSTIERTIHADS